MVKAKKVLVWTTLWNAYPDYINFTSEAVKQSIGGSVNQAHLKNTCAMRLSATLNDNGILVPGNRKGLVTKRGQDKRNYGIRVQEMDKWLRAEIGKPDFEIHKRENTAFDKASLAGMKGIIGFDIHFSDATGHLDLWDGTEFSSEHKMSRDYWVAAKRIWLWRAS